MLRAITDPEECKGKTVKKIVFSQETYKENQYQVMATFFEDDTYFVVRSVYGPNEELEYEHRLEIEGSEDLCRLNVEDFNIALGTHCKDFWERDKWSNRFDDASLWSDFRG